MRFIQRCFMLAFAGILTTALAHSVQAEPTLTPAAENTFSIVVIPDTQAYRGAGTKGQPDSTDPVSNPIFAAHTQWIVENLQRQNIVFVSHVGDIVDKNVPEQWEVARGYLDRLHGKVPYGLSVGNHDMTSRGDARLFQQYFPARRFEGFSWYGGAYSGSPLGAQVSGNNVNSYQLFSAGGIDFIFVHLECNAPDDVLEWANALLRKHADRKALITSHMGWGPRVKPKDNAGYITGEKGRMTWSKIHADRGNSPQAMWEKCYQHHRNLVAVFSGDQSRTHTFRAATPGVHGNVVHEFMQDYSSRWLRLYRFTPDAQQIRVQAITFHPKSEELCQGTSLVPDPSGHQFEFVIPR